MATLVASCKVGRNPIVNGREFVHTRYHAIMPDKGSKRTLYKFPNLKKELNDYERQIKLIYKILIKALPQDS